MKKILSLILALVMMIMPLCVEAFADDSDVNYDDQIMPCYTYLDSIVAGITEKALGFVCCTSSFITFESDKTCILTCYLQRTDGRAAWDNYKSQTKTFCESGSSSIDKTWYAPSGYSYRVYTLLVIKNSSGALLETATKASGVIYK